MMPWHSRFMLRVCPPLSFEATTIRYRSFSLVLGFEL